MFLSTRWKWLEAALVGVAAAAALSAIVMALGALVGGQVM